MALFQHTSGERVHIPDGSTHPGTRGEHARLTESPEWTRIGDDYEPAAEPTAQTTAAPAATTTDKPTRKR